MSTQSLYRFGALAGILSGVFMILGRMMARMPNTQPGEIVDWLSPFCALFLTIVLYFSQRKQSGILGFVAFVLLFSGLVFLVCLDFYGAFIRIYLPQELITAIEEGPSAPVFVTGLLVFLAGELLFGLSVMRAGVFSRIAAVLFMIGLFPIVLHPTGLLPEGVVDIAAVTVGGSLIWWSYELSRLPVSEADQVAGPIGELPAH